MTTEELQQLVAANAIAIAELRSSQSNTTANIEVMLEGQTRLQGVQIEMAQTQAQLGQTQETIAQNLVELRAGQERQERILDFLIRKYP